MIPQSFAWLVPDGAAQVWLVDLPLAQGTEWNDGLAEEIARRLNELTDVRLSIAHSHPRPEDYDIERFTRVQPFPLAEWDGREKRPVVTFIWRDDRLWTSHGLSRHLRNAIAAQQDHVDRLWTALAARVSGPRLRHRLRRGRVRPAGRSSIGRTRPSAVLAGRRGGTCLVRTLCGQPCRHRSPRLQHAAPLRARGCSHRVAAA